MQPVAPWLWQPPMPALPPMPKKQGPKKETIIDLAPKRRKLYQSIVDGNVDDQRAGEVQKWLEIIELAIFDSQVGRHLAQDQMANDSKNMAQIVRDSFANKATGTLATRSCALFLYLRWFAKVFPADEKPFPLTEHRVYSYLTHLNSTGAHPSKVSSLLKAWNFAVGVLGFDDPTAVAKSARCIGSAFNQLLKKRPLAQKEPLPVTALIALELAIVHGSTAQIRALAGYCCICIYARARASDAGRIAGLRDDSYVAEDGFERGVLEARALATKTARTGELKRRFLPVAFPVISRGAADP